MRFGEELLPRGLDQRMHDRFEPGERGGVADHHVRKLGAVDFAAGGRSGKRPLDERHGFPFVKRVHDRIGIVHRHAFLGEELCGPRFAHAERTGQAKDEWALRAHARRHPRRRRKSSTAISGNPRMVK